MATKTLEKLSKSELYEKAQAADVPGRSQMDKDELIDALSDGGRGPKSQPSTSKRSIWNGAITFGLITIPVGLYTATEDRDVSFHLLSGKDKSRIEYKRVSSKTGREVDWDDIVKGYEYEKGKYVVFTPEELEQIAPESARSIDVVQFVDESEVDPIFFEKSYYVAPTDVAVKAYELFVRAPHRVWSRRSGQGGHPGEGATLHPPCQGRNARSRNDEVAGRDPAGGIRAIAEEAAGIRPGIEDGPSADRPADR